MEPNVLLAGLAVLLGCGIGFLVGKLRAHRRAKAQGSLPRKWPLDPRRLVSSQERKVWHWLNHVFPDHHVMVKIAVTRFTLPHRGENGKLLYEALNGVHCTFTVCSNDGRVVGCVDVPGPQGISRMNRHMKVTLLSQCGIVYRVVQPGDLPTATEIRIDFVGEEAFALFDRNREVVAVGHAQQELRAAVQRQREHRQLGRPERGAAASTQDAHGSESVYGAEFASRAWQPNSFLAPLGSDVRS